MADLRLQQSTQMQMQQKMSMQMLQSLQIMALPLGELSDRIYEEVEKNPALEITRDSSVEPFGVRLTSHSGSADSADAWQAFLENTPEIETSLQQHLLKNFALLSLSDDERRIGELIIQNLNENGFHNVPPETLLRIDDSLEQMAKVLDIIRRLDPIGTACFNIQESLVFQSQLIEGFPLLAKTILKKYFFVLEKKRPTLIQKELGRLGVECTLEEIEIALNAIRSLEPFPARNFQSSREKTPYVIPEAIVRRATKDESDEQFIIEFLRGNIPDIALSPVYEDVLKQKNVLPEQKKFTRDSLAAAKNFLFSLEQRSRSIHRAIYAIVEHQGLFFDKGPGNLIPFLMKDLAKKLSLHEATISRLVNGKYIQCEWGFFELSYFFSHAVTSENEKSADSVKHLLQKIIQEHDSEQKKLSDSRLVQLLAEKGVSIARRTVAKYRSELQIESSFDRT